MEPSSLSPSIVQQIIVQLGIGGSIGAGTLWILREYLFRADTRIDKRDEAFVKFVNDHNDKMSTLVVESTMAIKESSEAIKEATRAIKTSTDMLCRSSIAERRNG
jgi:hypothetical protein